MTFAQRRISQNVSPSLSDAYLYSPCILIAVMSIFPITPYIPQVTVIHEHELGWHDGEGDGVNSRWRRPGEQQN